MNIQRCTNISWKDVIVFDVKKKRGGIFSDKTIEEILMKSLKSSAGLTRGRGVDETQTAVWTAIAPLVAQINLKMRKMTRHPY